MRTILDYDGLVMRFLSTMVDLMLINLIYILTSLPIFTIGASTTALYTVLMRKARKEEPAIIKQYFITFKSNFKKSTPVFLILLAVGIFIYVDFNLLKQMQGSINTVLIVVLSFLSLIYIIVFTYIFPFIARFDNTLKNYFKFSVLMGLRHLLSTILLLLITGLQAVALFMFSGLGIMASILILFALFAYLKSFLFVKIFSKYEPDQEENPERADTL